MRAGLMMTVLAIGASASGYALSNEQAPAKGQQASKLAAPSSAFVLTCSTETAGQDEVVVTSSDGTPRRVCIGSGEFAYLAGSVLNLRVPFPNDKVNCIHFSGWSGACSGQGNPCTLVLNSDLTANVDWAPTRGCDPK